MELLNALFTAALDQNLVFVQLVGMVSVLLVAERPQDAFRFGGMVWAASFLVGLIGWPLYTGLFQPWGISYLAPMAYLVVGVTVSYVIAAVMAAGKDREVRDRTFMTASVVAVNAAMLAVPMGNAAVAATSTFDVALGSSLGAGMGAFIAIVAFAFLRDRIDERLVPGVLRGLPISLITASLVALAFTGVAGIAGGLFV